MLYLVQYLPRACAPVRPLRGVRVEVETLLNRPGYHGDAYVRVFVEDTSQRRVRAVRSRRRDSSSRSRTARTRSGSSSTSRPPATARTRSSRSRP